MEHLRADGIIVFLHLEIATLLSRIRNYKTRGLVKSPDQTFEELFHERLILYRKYADVTVSCGGSNRNEVCANPQRIKSAITHCTLNLAINLLYSEV